MLLLAKRKKGCNGSTTLLLLIGCDQINILLLLDRTKHKLCSYWSDKTQALLLLAGENIHSAPIGWKKTQALLLLAGQNTSSALIGCLPMWQAFRWVLHVPLGNVTCRLLFFPPSPSGFSWNKSTKITEKIKNKKSTNWWLCRVLFLRFSIFYSRCFSL